MLLLRLHTYLKGVMPASFAFRNMMFLWSYDVVGRYSMSLQERELQWRATAALLSIQLALPQQEVMVQK